MEIMYNVQIVNVDIKKLLRRKKKLTKKIINSNKNVERTKMELK